MSSSSPAPVSSPTSSVLATLSDVKSSVDAILSAGSITDSASVLALLDRLSPLTPSITQELLLKTQIGVSINKLSKLEPAEVKAKAKAIVNDWKSAVLKNSTAAASPTAAAAGSATKRKEPEKPSADIASDHQKRSKSSPSPVATSSSVPAPSPSPSPTTPSAASSAPIRYPAAEEILGQVSDPVRSKIQRSLFEALGGSASQHEAKIAVDLENEIFNTFGRDTNAQYRQKYREIAMNLKDKHNPDINENLLYGVWSPAEVVAMPVTELASQAMKDERKKERDWHAQEIRSDLDKNRGMTDMFRCGKCGERKCTYYQKQTRSADEPMTTFVNCTVCGNRWKC